MGVVSDQGGATPSPAVAESGESQGRAGVHVSRLQSPRSSKHENTCSMLTQERRTDNPLGVTCADCGALVQRRIACIDGMTHSTVELCERCWSASQQRQAGVVGRERRVTIDGEKREVLEVCTRRLELRETENWPSARASVCGGGAPD